MLLSLLDDVEKIRVVGRVVWISPIAQTGRPQGVGVQFGNDLSGKMTKSKIEDLLGNSMLSSRSTYTI